MLCISDKPWFSTTQLYLAVQPQHGRPIQTQKLRRLDVFKSSKALVPGDEVVTIGPAFSFSVMTLSRDSIKGGADRRAQRDGRKGTKSPQVDLEIESGMMLCVLLFVLLLLKQIMCWLAAEYSEHESNRTGLLLQFGESLLFSAGLSSGFQQIVYFLREGRHSRHDGKNRRQTTGASWLRLCFFLLDTGQRMNHLEMNQKQIFFETRFAGRLFWCYFTSACNRECARII